MGSLNQVNLIGRLGRDPEYRIGGKSGAGFTLLSIATDSRQRAAEGEPQAVTEWHRVVLVGKLADIARDYLAKGRLVYVRGHLHTRKYQRDGRDQYITEVIGDDLQMLDRPPEQETSTAELRFPEAMEDGDNH